MMKQKRVEYTWKDRKRPFCGLPLSFTQYILIEDRLLVRRGLFTLHEDEVRLYRIKDISITRTLGQRIFGVGTVHIVSADAQLANFDLKDIKNSYKVKELISKKVEEERERKNVSTKEIYTTSTGQDEF